MASLWSWHLAPIHLFWLQIAFVALCAPCLKSSPKIQSYAELSWEGNPDNCGIQSLLRRCTWHYTCGSFIQAVWSTWKPTGIIVMEKNKNALGEGKALQATEAGDPISSVPELSVTSATTHKANTLILFLAHQEG